MSASRYHYLRPGIEPSLRRGTLFQEAETQATRFSYAEAIIAVGQANPDAVVLNADVSKGIRTCDFAEVFPDRSYNLGIAEQNMVAAAAGMATTGVIPFVSTYAVFAALRALDQIRNSICYPRLNVKIAASHSGITAAPDGVTHQGQEDLAIMRALPHMTVIAAADRTTTHMATHAAAALEGPVYLSLSRDPVPVLYSDDYPFEIGRAVTVREGVDVALIANRDMVAQALLAAEALAADGIDARVIDCHTLKPLDAEAILAAANETGAIVTAENSTYYGGLGSAVAELLVEHAPVPMRRVGIADTFAESGPYLDLIDKYGLSARHIVTAAREVLQRKARAQKAVF
ncbi:MAG TPA: transketolase family protein [Chloroflexi bacterium]|jgi:transketolase|nr:transketolase family protein [Chloroflexota bacterium]